MQYRRSRTTGATFFFTVVTDQRRKILCHEVNVNLLKEAFYKVIRQHQFTMEAVVLLPDHIHCIWTLPEDDHDFSIRWREIKSYFSRRCPERDQIVPTASRLMKREVAVWQRRFWEHQIRDDRDFRAHVEYIHFNPVKHGWAKSPRDWPHSSFHRYVRAGVYESGWGAGEEVKFDPAVGHE